MISDVILFKSIIFVCVIFVEVIIVIFVFVFVFKLGGEISPRSSFIFCVKILLACL